MAERYCVVVSRKGREEFRLMPEEFEAAIEKAKEINRSGRLRAENLTAYVETAASVKKIPLGSLPS